MVQVTTTTKIRALAVLGGLGVGALLCAAAPAAAGDPGPGCTAADLAQVNVGVSAATAVYLFSHPEVNEFLTHLEGSPPDTVTAQVNQYMTANPQVRDELGGIRQPLADLKARCGESPNDDSTPGPS